MAEAMPELKCAWASHEAAKWACEHWHYSKCLPAGKLFKVGAWEDGRYIGVVIFSRGATQNIGKPYGLEQTECVELTRIALRDHRHFVSEIMMQALRKLKETNPGLRLVVSYADPAQGHNGGIYQATNWVYTGATPPAGIQNQRKNCSCADNSAKEAKAFAGIRVHCLEISKCRAYHSGRKTQISYAVRP